MQATDNRQCLYNKKTFYSNPYVEERRLQTSKTFLFFRSFRLKHLPVVPPSILVFCIVFRKYEQYMLFKTIRFGFHDNPPPPHTYIRRPLPISV